MAEHLVIGSDGMLGRAVMQLLRTRFGEPDAPALEDLDLTRADTVERSVRREHRVVVNCAAWTDVDGAEENEAAATEVNGAGLGHLAERCREVGALLVHFSTDYVFDGQGDRPYRPDDPTSPVNAYGRSKLDGEERVRASGCEHLIVRTSWLYAPWGKNFVLTMAELARERDELRVVNDQRGRPTSAEYLAATSLALVEAGARGLFHACDGGECTWFDLASEVARLVSPRCQVHPCTTAELPRPARRPAYSVLDSTETERITGPAPPWRDNVRAALGTGGLGQ